MKKILYHKISPHLISKIILRMKLSILFFFATLFTMHANTGYSQAAELSLDLDNVSVERLLEEIESHSEFRFVYRIRDVDLKRVISLRVQKEDIKTILDRIFAGTRTTYEIMDRQIFLIKRKKMRPSLRPVELLSRQDRAIEQAPVPQDTISGLVTDAEGEPLIGVNVQVKGTTKGTATDFDGQFVLINVDDDGVLGFSYIGYQKQEVLINGRSSVNVTLLTDAALLDEVVVVGYGSIKKRDLTGSVSTVQGELISDRQTPQLSHALQGALPGVMVTRNGNRPGSDASIRIRGITTIGNSNPLIMIDGRTGSLDDVNPQDIKSISVLKDAASASIYGSRAAAGVILIETNRAISGESSFKYDVQYGFDTPTRLPVYVGAVESMQLYNEARYNDAKFKGSEYPLFPKELIDKYPSLHAEDPYAYPDYDWQGNGLNDYAQVQRHNMSFSIGTEKLRTKTSIGYDKQDKLYSDIANDDVSYERLTVRINNDADINDYLSGIIDVFYTYDIDREGAPTRGGTILDNRNITFNPLYTPFWEDGRPTEGRSSWNNHAILRQGGFNNFQRNRMGGKLSLDFEPFERFKITGVVSPNYLLSERKDWRKEVPYYERDELVIPAGFVDGAKLTSLGEARNKSYDITTNFLIHYDFSLQKEHDFNLLAGYENYYSFNESLSSSGNQFELSFYPYLNLSNPSYLEVGGSASEIAYQSYFGRILYNYKNKYLFQANIRYDGSSRFNKDNRWGSFPSISAGWVLSEEQFLESSSLLSYLKIRASYGILGNDRIGKYPYQSTISFGNNLFYQGDDIVPGLNSRVTVLGIPTITWETTETFGIGFDSYFFDNKLRFTGDYYVKNTRDMLLKLEIPDFMGVSNPDQNTGKMITKGWEIDLGYSNQIGEINYSVSANLSDFRSIMGDLGGTEFLGSKIKREGSEFNEWYGYKTNGLFQTEAELIDAPVLNSTVGRGDIKLIDLSGYDDEPDGKISPDYDRVELGGSLPRFLFGGNFKMNYKNIDFSLAFQGVGKQNVRINPNFVKPNVSNDEEISQYYADNRWSIYNTDEENLNTKFPRFTKNAVSQMFAFSDYWLSNGAYFRLKNVMVGYTLPLNFVEQIEKVRIYANVSNLFSIDNYYAGWDPESASGSYWMTKTYHLGISLKL